MQFVIIRPRSYNKQHVCIMHVSLFMFSAGKDCAYNALIYNTVLYSLIHTAVTSTADVNSGNGFISHHIIPSYNMAQWV